MCCLQTLSRKRAPQPTRRLRSTIKLKMWLYEEPLTGEVCEVLVQWTIVTGQWLLLATATDVTRWRQSYDLASLFEPQNCSDERMMELGLKLADCNNMDGYAQIRNTLQHSAEERRLCRSVAYSWAVLHADPRVVWRALNWVYRMGKFQECWLTDVG